MPLILPSEDDLGTLSLENNEESLEAKIERVFGSLSIDKRRLPASRLQSRGVPGYVAEWVIDTVAPSRGPLSLEDAAQACRNGRPSSSPNPTRARRFATAS